MIADAVDPGKSMGNDSPGNKKSFILPLSAYSKIKK